MLLWLPQKPAIFRLGMIYGNVTRGTLQSIARSTPHAPLLFVWEWEVERNPDTALLLIGSVVCSLIRRLFSQIHITGFYF